MSSTTRWRYVGPYTSKPFLVAVTGTWCRHPDAHVDAPDHVETTDSAAAEQLDASPYWERVKSPRTKKITKAAPVSAPTIVQED